MTSLFIREVFWDGSKRHRRMSCHAQNSNHFCLEFNFSSNSEPSQNSRTKKVSHLRILTRDQYFEQKLKRNWIVRTLSHLKITCICHHVTWHPSMSFWAISRYPPYVLTRLRRCPEISGRIESNNVTSVQYNL